MIRRLEWKITEWLAKREPDRWPTIPWRASWLHRLIYLIAPLGIVHFWWMKAGKNNFTEPIIFGVIVALLLGVRVYWNRRKAMAAA